MLWLLKQSETVLEHLTPVTLTFDPKINRIPLLSRMEVWTKFEEGRSRRSRVIDRKQKGYRCTDRPTDMCKPICTLPFEGGHNNRKSFVGKKNTQ